MWPRFAIAAGFIVLCALLFSGAGIHAKGVPPKDVSVQEAADVIKKSGGKLVIVDVRTPAEYVAGHLPNARNMDFFGGRFESDLAALPRNGEILLYCRSGKRSAGAADIMGGMGFKNVRHMNEGYDAWVKAGMPVEKGDASGKDKKQ